MTNLIFIICFHNAASFIQECAYSLLGQEYKNWKAIFVDDCSIDNTVDRIPIDQRFSVTRNKTRQTSLPNIHYAITSAKLNDEDVICLLDGDDKLTMPTVCTMLNEIYNTFNPLITYGQYITSQGVIGHCRPYTAETLLQIRNNYYWASHLRTFKYKLYKEIMMQDQELSCYKDSAGRFYTMAYDVAMMTPMLEIAGINKIFFNPLPFYYYRIHPNNDHLTNFNLQTSIANEIYGKPKFKQVF